jgi:hypothetical protein
LALAEEITRARRRTVVIISTHEPFESDNPRIVCGNMLSIRQIARLTEHIDLFVGCGSGLTVAATSEAAKRGLSNIQILRRSTSVFASFRHDFAYFGKPTLQFMELTSEDLAHLAKALIAAVCDGLASARERFDDPVPLDFQWYLQLIQQMLVDVGRYVEAMQSLLITTDRYGWHHDLRRFGRYFVLPFLEDDPRAALPHRRIEIERERFRAGLA